jgi:CrcB protein
MIKSLLCISLGASTGAVLRWLLGLTLNSFFPLIPLGTLTANLLGGYLVGFAVSLFLQFPHMGEEWRLLLITGFLGGLTTFSAFTAEVASLVQAHRFVMATAAAAVHVCGSLVMLFFGIASFSLLKRLLG